jgi:hypothetical protein
MTAQQMLMRDEGVSADCIEIPGKIWTRDGEEKVIGCSSETRHAAKLIVYNTLSRGMRYGIAGCSRRKAIWRMM